VVLQWRPAAWCTKTSIVAAVGACNEPKRRTPASVAAGWPASKVSSISVPLWGLRERTPAVDLQRPKDAHRVIGTPGPAASAIDHELVVGWRHRQPMAAQQPPSRVPPGQAGLLQPVDRSSHRGRLTLERVGEDANLERAAVVQQQPEGASEQGPVIGWPLGKRKVVGTVGHDRSLTTRHFQTY
jgi:hypothetical protein